MTTVGGIVGEAKRFSSVAAQILGGWGPGKPRRADWNTVGLSPDQVRQEQAERERRDRQAVNALAYHVQEENPAIGADFVSKSRTRVV